MSNMKIIFKLGVFLILIISSIQSLTNEGKSLSFDTVYSEELQNSEMKFYSLNLDSNVNNSDLLIETQKTDSTDTLFESPLVLVSLKPLPNEDKSTQWICNQLGSETCFVPNKYLTQYKQIYLGVLCENCKFSIKPTYVKEERLFEGESRLLHLKSGDKKVFVLDKTFEKEQNWIQINSYNLKMTNFKMEVEIVEKDTQKVISVPVTTNWIGGQQTTIKPNTQEAKTNFSYRVIISANENGVFDIEARTSKSVIKLHEKSLKFETIKKDTNVCFSYNIKHHIEDSFVIDVKSVKGDLNLKVHPNNTNDSLTINVKSEEEIKYEVTKDYRVSKNAQKGLWLICAETPENSEDSTFFTIHVYTTKNTKKVKEYKQLLYKLTINDQMYNLENIQATKPEMKDISNIPAFRALVQTDTSATTTDTASTTVSAEPTILINGNGISGLIVIVVFAVPVLIGSFALMNTFVSTKFLDSLIKIKVME